MAVIGLDHRGIRTSKLEETRHFYENLLGLTRGYRPEALSTKGYWLYAGGAPIIHLIEDQNCTAGKDLEARETLNDAGGQTHIALSVVEAKKTVHRLAEAGVHYWDRLFKEPIMYQVFVEDPNGLLVELIDRHPGEIDGPICKVVE